MLVNRSQPSCSWACWWTVPYWDPVLLELPWVLGLSCHPGRMQRCNRRVPPWDGTPGTTTQNNKMKMDDWMKCSKYSKYSVSTNTSFEAPKTKLYKLLKNGPIEAIAASHHPPKAVSFPYLKLFAEFRCTPSDRSPSVSYPKVNQEVKLPFIII